MRNRLLKTFAAFLAATSISYADNMNDVFEDAINNYLIKRPLCANFQSMFIPDEYENYVKTNFGVIVEKQEKKIEGNNIEEVILPQLGDSILRFDQFKQLTKDGILFDTIKKVKISDTQTDIIHLYNATDEGKKYLPENYSKYLKNTDGILDGELCYGRVKVKSIIDYIEMDAYKVKFTEVNYYVESYDIASWWSENLSLYIRAAGASMRLSGDGKKTMNLVKSSTGWRPMR